MVKDLLTQWNDAVWSAERLLFVLPSSVDADSFAAACALGHALSHAGRSVTLLCPRPVASHSSFLLGNLSLHSSLQESVTYTCNLPSSLAVSHIDHSLSSDGSGKVTLQFHQSPSLSSLAELTFTPQFPAFDRICIFGALDLPEIAPLFSHAHHLLSDTPLVTFNWHPSSEAFGRWNVLYEHATTLCEVAASFLRETAPESLRDHVATCILTGIIAKTKHYRSASVTPAILSLSADLVSAGADRLRIIEELYRTRSVASLRLWGIACSRLQEILPDVLFSEITEDDFLRTQTTPSLLQEIASEVLQSSEKLRAVVFFYRERGLLHARIVARQGIDARLFIGALRTDGARENALHIFSSETEISPIVSTLQIALR